MEKVKLLFIINQFFKGGAETALLNLLSTLSEKQYEIDLLIFDQIPLAGTISLIPEVPKWIHVINPVEREGYPAFIKKAYFWAFQKIFGRQLFRKDVIKRAGEKQYDAVISFGEWFSSRLASEYVRAKRRYIWIHADIDKASFLHPDILRYQQAFDRFIFASERSMRSAEKQYPALQGRGIVIHNLVNEEQIRSLSLEASSIPINMDLPILLTVANLREEKNHLRQIAVMKRLFQQGKRFYWLNAGSMANYALSDRIKSAIREAGLESYFLLLGAVENPYPLMKKAAAVCVLSDHESWSMVITEAKALGVPVIATRTSGAVEQIRHLETGMLCGFSEEDIAETIQYFLDDANCQRKIRHSLSGFSAQSDSLERLEPLLQNQKKKIAFAFDDVNYLSGARNAALAQMEFINTMAEVSLFSTKPCQDRGLKGKYRALDFEDNYGLQCLTTSCRKVLADNVYSKRWKIVRLLYAVLTRLRLEGAINRRLLQKHIFHLLNSYDTVCVVSEASKLRYAVAELQDPKKVQWIHTDYTVWREQSKWTKAITRYDGRLYKKFDTIVCLSECLKDKFTAFYPHLKEKTIAIHNFIQVGKIQKLAENPIKIPVNPNQYNLITIGRMEWEKRYDLVLQTAAGFKEKRIPFHWYLVGEGPLMEEVQELAGKLKILEEVTFTGKLDNPYPLLKQCCALVLLSDYEGTPVTIDEAKVLGVPVLARDVGGIKEQLAGGYGEVIQGKDVCVDMLERIHVKKYELFTVEKSKRYQDVIEEQLKIVFEV